MKYAAGDEEDLACSLAPFRLWRTEDDKSEAGKWGSEDVEVAGDAVWRDAQSSSSMQSGCVWMSKSLGIWCTEGASHSSTPCQYNAMMAKSVG